MGRAGAAGKPLWSHSQGSSAEQDAHGAVNEQLHSSCTAGTPCQQVALVCESPRAEAPRVRSARMPLGEVQLPSKEGLQKVGRTGRTATLEMKRAFVSLLTPLEASAVQR